MVKRLGLPMVGVLLAAAVLVAGAGAIAQPPASHGIDLSSRASIAKYLKSVGVDPSGIVIQRGTHNYAGPTCPGVGWSCTTATRVVQFGPNNKFQCSASNGFGGSANAPDDCTIVQVAPTSTANNSATCVENGTDPTASQSCVIFQTSTGGSNTATVVQQVKVSGSTTQDVSQYSGIDQESGDGANSATVTQTINGSISSNGKNSAGDESQDGHQGSSLTQSASGAGNNMANVSQSLALNAATSGVKTISQMQNTDASRGPNTNSDIEQTSATGTNAATLNQLNDLKAAAAGAFAGAQQQGTTSGGENGKFNQSSTGVSTIQGTQVEHQHLVTNPGPNSTVTQEQYGPQFYDPNQGSNTADTYELDQTSDQQQNNPVDLQDDQQYAQCSTTGIDGCTVTQTITQNGQSSSNSCGPASFCDTGQTQTTTSEGTSSSSCGTGGETESGCDVSFPPPPPPPGGTTICELECGPIVAGPMLRG
jgi:hypothetical protein